MLAIISCFYNPCQYHNLKTNYYKYRAALGDVPYFCAELGFEEFVTDAQIKIKAQDDGHILWQKERLLNLCIEQLPDKYDQVAWIDADVIFTNENWYDETVELLQDYPIVQMAERIEYMDAIGNIYERQESAASYWQNKKTDFTLAAPGLAWAAHRDVFADGLYDVEPTGGADVRMFLACLGDWAHGNIRFMNTKAKRHFLEWAAPVYRQVRGNVGCLRGCITHLFHGYRKDRKYAEKNKAFRSFVPDDLELDGGIWRWRNERLKATSIKYFKLRDEDTQATALPEPVRKKVRQLANPKRAHLTPDDLEWISTSRLVEDALKLMAYIEPDHTAIIGNPRSGMIPAAVLACHCHLPLYSLTPTGPQRLHAGSRGTFNAKGPQKFFFVDDSSHHGGSLIKAKNILRGHDVTYAAVYALCPELLDCCAELHERVHIFSWNIFNNWLWQGQAVDPRLRGIGFLADWDGILSPDCTWQHRSDNEDRVIRWMRNVKPLRWVPRLAKIPAIVSFRLNKHRRWCDEWLHKWGIRCDQLRLHPAGTFEERDRSFNVAQHKGLFYASNSYTLFFESCPRQSQIIANVSGKPTCCPTEGRFFFPT